MEMHQVRYFLATVSELNFTKAADKCNVTQPSLTRAIKQLEAVLRKRARSEIAGIRDKERRSRYA
jgi:DNA-binding transcriptional LysR family regulator